MKYPDLPQDVEIVEDEKGEFFYAWAKRKNDEMLFVWFEQNDDLENQYRVDKTGIVSRYNRQVCTRAEARKILELGAVRRFVYPEEMKKWQEKWGN